MRRQLPEPNLIKALDTLLPPSIMGKKAVLLDLQRRAKKLCIAEEHIVTFQPCDHCLGQAFDDYLEELT